MVSSGAIPVTAANVSCWLCFREANGPDQLAGFSAYRMMTQFGGVILMSEFRSTNKGDDASAILVAFSSVFLRFALGFSFLSAVGDRFGFWGSFGEHHVAWGTFARFVAYTGQLNWFLPKGTITTLAIVSTCPKLFLVFCCCWDGRRGPRLC